MTSAASRPASSCRRQLPPVVAAVLTVLLADVLAAAVVAGVWLGPPYLAKRIVRSAWEHAGVQVVGAGELGVAISAGPMKLPGRGATRAGGG